MENIEEFPEMGDSSFEDGEKLLSEINEAEKMKTEQLRVKVEAKFNALGKEFIFDLGEDS